MMFNKFPLASSPEALIHPYYGLPVFDGPNSIVVAGFDDFGPIGAILYPVGLSPMYNLYYRTVRRFIRDRTVILFVLITLLFNVLYIEQALADAFVVLRNLTLLLPVILFVDRLSRSTLDGKIAGIRSYARILRGEQKG